MSTRILVIDDEEAVTEILKFNLEKEGYEVDCAYSAEEALDMDLGLYQLFMVDIMMDQLSGYDFAKRVRNVTRDRADSHTFLFGAHRRGCRCEGTQYRRRRLCDQAFCHRRGALRVRAILRRTGAQFKRTAADIEAEQGIYETDITFKGLRIDRNDKECYLDNEPVTLTRTEFDILLFFLTHRNRIYSREEIIRNVWGDEVVVSQRTIDTNITRLRKKLGDYDKYIITRQGFGYGFKEKN